MSIEIHDGALEKRLRQQVESTGASSVEELLRSLLESKEEQDRWLMENHAANDEKIRRGLAELDRGEGISEDRLPLYLSTSKPKLK